MLRSLQIKNFKGWQDTGKIRFAPITLFMGSNSSGKSSIGQLLMLLKQSSTTSDRRTVLFLGDSNAVVELGGPIDMLYKHDSSKHLEFSYKWSLPEQVSLVTSSGSEEESNSFLCDEIAFSDQIAVHETESQTLEIEKLQFLEVEKMQYDILAKNILQFSVGLERVQKPSSARAYKMISRICELKRVAGRAWEMPSPYRFYGFPDEMIAYYKNAWFTPQLNALHERFFSTISYLGPLRERAERHYRWTGFIPSSVGVTGKDTILALLAARAGNRLYNYKAKQHLQTLDVIIANAMKNMGLIEHFEITKIAEGRQDYDVKVMASGSQTLTDIPDVGFGISQVLPVLVQLYYAPANSIIIMEQPELHLHPSAQSALADAMIDAISAREKARPRNIQLIIETHSEHFLRRFQRRIAEGSLSNESFAAFFANNDTTPLTLEQLQINLFGEIINWPRNFFGDMNGDIFMQTKAALERKLKEVQ